MVEFCIYFVLQGERAACGLQAGCLSDIWESPNEFGPYSWPLYVYDPIETTPHEEAPPEKPPQEQSPLEEPPPKIQTASGTS